MSAAPRMQGSSPASHLIQVSVSVGGQSVLTAKMIELRNTWEATSFQLERLQSNPICVEQEEQSMSSRTAPPMKLTYEPTAPKAMPPVPSPDAPKVCVLREEGSNGDREMVAAFSLAGFEVWDGTMSDLVQGRLTLERFRGLVFVGGFSYADVCGSAKVRAAAGLRAWRAFGHVVASPPLTTAIFSPTPPVLRPQGWAGAALFNPSVRAQLDAFRSRSDTFSLGICNGCQLMALLGWVGPAASGEDFLVGEGGGLFGGLGHLPNRPCHVLVPISDANDTPASKKSKTGGQVHPTMFTHNISGAVVPWRGRSWLRFQRRARAHHVAPPTHHPRPLRVPLCLGQD